MGSKIASIVGSKPIYLGFASFVAGFASFTEGFAAFAAGFVTFGVVLTSTFEVF